MKFAAHVQSRRSRERALASIALSSIVIATGCGARTGLSLFDASPLSSSVGGFGGVSASAGLGGTVAAAGSGAVGGTNGGVSGIGGMSGVGGASASPGLGGESGSSGDAGSTANSGAGGALCNPGMPSCAIPGCGDGVVEAPEQCDDGNRVSGDGCSATCTWEPVAIAVGPHSSCARAANGVLKCWGNDSSGELGLGDNVNRGGQPGQMGDNLPAVSLGTGRTPQAIAAGWVSNCALLDNGAVKCWGDNGEGQLGLGDTTNRGDLPGEMGDNLPAADLGAGNTATAIAMSLHTCALFDTGSVKCWGDNIYGQLGLGDTTNRGDQPGQMGDNLPTVNLGTGRTARAIATGELNTCALLDNDTVKCWGWNAYGQLGLGDPFTRGDQPRQMSDNLPTVNLGTGRTARAITLGDHSTCALLDNGAVKCWGFNLFGQLGLGDSTNRGDQPGQMGDNLPTVNLGTGRTAQSITTDGLTCARLDDATVKCWGFNAQGQLGLGDPFTRGILPGQMGDNLPTVNLGTGRTTRAIITGSDSTCALLDNGTVKCWGANSVFTNLGLGDTLNRGDAPNEMGDNLPAVDLTF